MEEMKAILEKYFSQKDEIDTVILFGSFANGKFNEKSDVDIALHSCEELDFEKLAQMQTELSLLCGREIDLADLSKAEGVFLCQIMRGMKIKFTPKVFMKYQMKALFLREDFLPILERCRKERLRRFANGT